MKEISLRNVLILLAAVIIALLVLGFVSTLLNQLIPITIALVAGVVLGRMSVRVNLLDMIKGVLRRAPAKPAAQAEQPAAETAQKQPDDAVRTEVEAIKQRIADVEDPPAQQAEKAEIADFDIKTEDEIQAEARQLEDEVTKRNAAYDPAAALAERRRRLLGDKADQS